ncbi:MAG: restriction endonuclease subunit S [Solirubrobacteraceae bacterium]
MGGPPDRPNHGREQPLHEAERHDRASRVLWRAGCAGVPHINLGIPADLSIPLPPLQEQREIASLLGALDGKIDSNRYLQRLLEQVQRAIFEHELVNQAQESWATENLTDIARFINGRAFTKDANGRGRPILRIKELNNGLTAGTLYSDIPGKDENVARHHDMLPAAASPRSAPTSPPMSICSRRE